jgi:hypothetical protein
VATEVIQDAAMNRFELLVDGAHAGVSEYAVRGDSIVFIHTEIDPAMREHGLASELVRGALNLVRAETELRVVASCPYVAAWIAKHPEYQDLLER